jgi:hypothetical protein
VEFLFYIFQQFRLEARASQPVEGGRCHSIVPSVVPPTASLGLPAAFTRLLLNSGQPLDGWLAKVRRYPCSSLQQASGCEFNPFRFTIRLRGWSLKKSPLETGLRLLIAPIEKPAVKRLAFLSR